MTISEIQKLDTGARVHGLKVVIKKTKKRSQFGDEITQEFVLGDSTGEILAEILLAKLVHRSCVHRSCGVETLIRNEPLTIIAGEIQQGAEGTRLYVSAYERYGQSEPDEPHYTSAEIEQNTKPDWNKIARGKTKCNIVCAMLSAGLSADRILDSHKSEIEKLINYIFE